MNQTKSSLTFIQRTSLIEFHQILQEHFDMGYWMLDFSTCYITHNMEVCYTAILSKEVPA